MGASLGAALFKDRKSVSTHPSRRKPSRHRQNLPRPRAATAPKLSMATSSTRRPRHLEVGDEHAPLGPYPRPSRLRQVPDGLAETPFKDYTFSPSPTLGRRRASHARTSRFVRQPVAVLRSALGIGVNLALDSSQAPGFYLRLRDCITAPRGRRDASAGRRSLQIRQHERTVVTCRPMEGVVSISSQTDQYPRRRSSAVRLAQISEA